MTIFGAIVAVIGSIPALEALFQQLIAFYVSQKIDKMKAEHLASIKAAIEGHDQRELEKIIGSQTAGKPSGIDGVTVVSHIDGLPDSKPKTSGGFSMAQQRPSSDTLPK